jgi:hypothetical protein
MWYFKRSPNYFGDIFLAFHAKCWNVSFNADIAFTPSKCVQNDHSWAVIVDQKEIVLRSWNVWLPAKFIKAYCGSCSCRHVLSWNKVTFDIRSCTLYMNRFICFLFIYFILLFIYLSFYCGCKLTGLKLISGSNSIIVLKKVFTYVEVEIRHKTRELVTK